MLKSKSDLSTVGGKIKYYRSLNGLLQKELSDISGIDRATILRYENNQVIHFLDICNKIAEIIGIDPFLIYDEYLSFIAGSFGSKIKLLRKSIKLTQVEFGQALGVHKKTIERWENEMACPTRENYILIKEYL